MTTRVAQHAVFHLLAPVWEISHGLEKRRNMFNTAIVLTRSHSNFSTQVFRTVRHTSPMVLTRKN